MALSFNSLQILLQKLFYGEVMHVWGQGAYGSAILSAQFRCEHKIALKNKVHFLKIIVMIYQWSTQLGFSPSFMESHKLETT